MKKSIQIIFLILILIPNKSFSQSNYNDYSNQDKQNIFFDDFDNNINNWTLFDNSSELGKIENGVFYYQSKDDNAKGNYISVNFDETKDWEIELKIKYVKGEDNNSNGLVFGANQNNDKKIQFAFSGNGQYNIYDFGTGNYLKKWTQTAIIEKSNYNLLTVRKINNSYYFFLNKIFIISTTYVYYGNKIGIKCNRNSTIYADYLKISYLEKQQIITDNTPPEITITYPNVSRGFKPVEQNKQITIQGNAKDASGIFEVLVNGQEAYIDAQGNFTKNVLLAVGDNSFTVTATDLKQNTATKTFIIERKSQQQETVIVNETTNNTNILQTGKYYALIIGNNSYQDNAISSLDEPINDATKLYNVLTTQYTFEPQNVTLLKNATYVQMIEALDNLSNTLTENDNLLIFYAGHGWWDEDKNLGYWLPTDAKKNSTAFWIANSRISDYMASINSKHTLLIADACFSGSIFKTRSAFSDAQPAINKLYELPSKTAMTSGNLKKVPDKSVFLQYLVKRLKDNTEKYISADMLFASFRIAVMNNSATEPQFGTIQNAGDEGGEFIFIRREK